MVSGQASLNLPDAQHPHLSLALPGPSFHEHPFFPPHSASQHSSNSSTPYPCCAFALNFPSAWNILSTPPSAHPTALFTYSWQCMDSNASSSLNPECSGLFQHLVLTYHVTIRGVLCLSSLPTVGSFWPGTCLTHFRIPAPNTWPGT